VNHDAGVYDQARLPVKTLRLRIRQDGSRILFEQIAATLGGTQPAGALTGNGSYSRGALRLDLATAGLDLRRLDSRLRPTRLAGSVALYDVGARQEITLALSEPVKREQLTLAAHAVLADAVIAVDRAELRLGRSAIEASGRFALTGTQAFSAAGKVNQFRPRDVGDFPQLPALLLSGSFAASGALGPTLAADLDFSIRDSQLSGQPLSGEGRVQLQADTLNVPNLLLVLGPNRLTAHGALSERDSQLAFTISAPQLEQIGPGFGGSIEATGTARGKLALPRINAEWKAANVQLPGPVRLEASAGKADVVIDRKRPFFLDTATVDATVRGLQSGAQRLALLSAKVRFAPQPDAPLALELEATGLAVGERSIGRLTLSGTGTTARHTLDIAVAERQQRWTLRAAGGLSDLVAAPQWRGSIEHFDAAGPVTARLTASAPLLVSQQRVQLDGFRLEANGALIDVEQFLREPERIATRGRIERLELAKVLAVAGPSPVLATDLVLDGDWNLRLTDALAGNLNVRRRQGDVTLQAASPVTLGLRTLQASATAGNGRLAVQVQADGQRLGHIEISADTAVPSRANALRIAPEAAISGRASIDVPSIAWAGPLVSPSLIASGQLQSNITLAGTFGDPRLDGRINGSGLRLLFADLGVDLRQGVLESEFDGNRLLVQRLQFQSSNDGTVAVTGSIKFAGGKPDLKLTLNATRYQLLNRSDRKLVLSGTGQITLADNKLRVGGALDVDSGYFDIGRTDAPALSDDVVIVGREKKAAGQLIAALDLRIKLGEGVALTGRGLDALLRGEIRLLNNAGEPLQAQGTLNVAKGTFTAYGQALAIEQGLVRFTGPLNNPALVILAMRREQEVAAGVSVRGTVLAPRITLVSDPGVPDAEKLSWLVLGRGLGSAGSGDLSALQAAAGALLTNSAANGVSSQIATAFGLDTLSVGTSDDTVQQRIVTLGKKISARLYVSYQKGLETASNALLLRYTLSPRLTVEAETGTRSVVSLFYNITFD
ncbi:MAG: translocation/assembly module TamB domain-containing protein, partial [Acidobacteriota bacterium]